jgi:hypothetical protein
MVRRSVQLIVEGKSLTNGRFDRYSNLLLSLYVQRSHLRYFNHQYWNGRFTDEQFSAVDITGLEGHVQQVEDLAVLHVQFASLEETVEMWWRVLAAETRLFFCDGQTHDRRWDQLTLDSDHLRLIPSNVRTYKPGIHVVRLNLAAHWEPDEGRTLDKVRYQAGVSGETLAQLEVMSAYGLHPALLREQNGTDLPYPDMAATDVSVSCYSNSCALMMGWDRGRRTVDLSARWVSSRERGWSAPILLQKS